MTIPPPSAVPHRSHIPRPPDGPPRTQPRNDVGRKLVKQTLSRTSGLANPPKMGRDMTFKVANKLLKHRSRTTPGSEFIATRSSPTGKSAQTYRRRNSSDVYEDFSSSLQNPTEWQDVLKSHRRRSTQFTDPDFPPSQASIGGGNLKVSGWSRISDIYGPTSLLVELSFFDDETMSMCGASPALTQAEFDSLPRESAPNHAEKAKKILTVALTSDDLSQLNLDDRMSSWLSSFASNHNDGLEVDRIDVKPVFSHKKGYVSTVRCYCRVQFKSFDIGMFQRGADGTFVDPADVCQGALGDCYFVGAMSTLGMQEEAILDVFPDLPADLLDPAQLNSPANEQVYNWEGVYAVRFWRGGKFRVVMIDDFIPCNENGKPAFASSAAVDGKVEIWTMLAEKAFAKLNGSYAAIVSGHEAEALQDLTGGIPENHDMQDIPDLWQLINNLLEEQASICCSKHGDGAKGEREEDSGIISNHAYGILRAVEFRDRGIRLVQIRNPWGSGVEWNGRFSDGDSRSWAMLSDRERSMLGGGGCDPTEKDGTWWMLVEDLKRHYSTIGACRPILRLDRWTRHLLVSSWNKETGCGGQLHLNPQVHLELMGGGRGQDLVKVLVCLTQVSKRVSSDNLGIHPLICGGVEKVGERVLKVTGDSRLHKMDAYTTSRNATVEIECKRSDFPLCVVAGVFGGGVGELASGAREANFEMSVCVKDQKTKMVLVGGDLPECRVCKKALKLPWVEHDGGVIVHSKCSDAYKEQTADKCLECGKGLVGSFYREDGGKVHADVCHERWRERNADKCSVCGKAVLGSHFPVDGGKVHDGACIEIHRERSADKCSSCGKAVMGSFFTIDGGKIHDGACIEAHRERTAAKCIVCKKAVRGQYYDIAGKGQCHVECHGKLK